jgi:tetratricopeptide (TPR) repeat protein
VSLLMDALKKAEEEKKKAAKRLEQVEANAHAEGTVEGESRRDSNSTEENVPADQFTETVKLSLEPIDAPDGSQSIPLKDVATVEVEDEDHDHDHEHDKEEAAQLSIDEVSIVEDLTLENPVSQEAFEKTQEAIDLNDTTIIEGLSTENVSAPFDDTFHGVLFEGEEPDTDVYEETLPGVPADQLVKDMGGGDYQPTPVAAQTVFSAGRTRTKSSYSWGAFLVLAVLALGSFAVFYYFTITPVARKLPSPAVARGIEFTSVPVPAIAEIIEPDVVSGTIISTEAEEKIVVDSEQSITDQESTDIQEQDTAVAMLDNENLIEKIQETGQEADVIDDVASDSMSSDVEGVTSESIATEETPAVSDLGKQSTIQQEPVISDSPETFIQADSELLKISKNKPSPKQNMMINEAFKAYQSGQFESAETLYRNVLQDEPENRDVHLGLAALAINKGDRESAYSHYLKLLDTNPADALALSSLISLSNNSDPVKDESVIKTLLHKEGKVPYLYFALGNIYAKQLRWAEAQQAFFNAYSLDSTNPDYVLNLAISLDKIGQYATALDFYSVAIELAQHSPARFNMSSVNDRIRVLNKVVEKVL